MKSPFYPAVQALAVVAATSTVFGQLPTPDKKTSTDNLATATPGEVWEVDANSNNLIDGTTVTLKSLIERKDVIINNGGVLVVDSGQIWFRTESFWMKSTSGSGSLTSGTGELHVGDLEKPFDFR